MGLPLFVLGRWRLGGQGKAELAGRERDKKGRYKSARKAAAKKKKAAAVDKRPLRPSQCRGHLRRELASSFKEIVSGFVTKAKDGSVQHVKLATELLEEPQPKRRGKGSAQLMLERLRRVGVDEAETPEVVDEDVWRE